jgi:hypothetical protein
MLSPMKLIKYCKTYSIILKGDELGHSTFFL